MSSFSRKMVELFGVGGALIFVVLMILLFLILGPWLLFWSIGVISLAAGFAVTIPLTFETWLAAVVFLFLIRGASSN